MSFRWEHMLNLFATLIIGFFLLMLGLGGIVLVWSSQFQQTIAHLFSGYPLLTSFICFGIALGGGLLFLSPFLKKRKKYIHISSGPYAVLLSDNVLHSYLKAYWKEIFPDHPVSYQLKANKKSIEIVAEFPAIPLEQQKTVVEQIEKDLENILRGQLGCTQNIHLACSFESQLAT